jgi:dihydroxy-acid dehydratase
LKATELGKFCALIADRRFSGGTSSLSSGHVSPEGGAIALAEERDRIVIDIPNGIIRLAVLNEVILQRRTAMECFGDQAWRPEQLTAWCRWPCAPMRQRGARCRTGTPR